MSLPLRGAAGTEELWVSGVAGYRAGVPTLVPGHMLREPCDPVSARPCLQGTEEGGAGAGSQHRAVGP